MVSEMIFDLSVAGNELTGMAHMSNWPGDASISEGKIDGNQISFTVRGKLPWSSRSKLSPNWGSVISGVVEGKRVTDLEERATSELPMEAKRIPR